MADRKIDLGKIASSDVQAEHIAAQLEGEASADAQPLWGEEFAASGGKAPPPPATAKA